MEYKKHTKQFAYERLSFKGLKIINVLSCTDENDRTLCGSNSVQIQFTATIRLSNKVIIICVFFLTNNSSYVLTHWERHHL